MKGWSRFSADTHRSVRLSLALSNRSAGPPVADMTLAQLDQRCEAAREARIAPLREAEIENCKAQPKNDPEFCDRHNADFGDGGRNVNGSVRPRMFDDLPEWVEALQERNCRQN